MMNVLNLIVILRNIRTSLWVWFYLEKGRKSSSKQIIFLLCPNDQVLLVKLDNRLIKEEHDVDIKLLHSIFGALTQKKYASLEGFKVQKAIYKSNDKKKSSIFGLITIPISS
jgi:hypothetical protein